MEPPASVGVPESLPVPASAGGGGGGGGGWTGVHVPWIEPGGATQGRPEQQSAFVVHDWPDCWQAVLLHESRPLAFGTHGLPLQHSLAIEQALPVSTQPVPPSFTPVNALQRGTPKGSKTQARNFGFCGPQQSARALEMLQV